MRWLALAGALAVVFLPGALGSSSAEPGVTPTSILLGGTAPFTGESSASASLARGAAAYFAYVNARGGVHGRTIAYTALDDGSDPEQALAETRRLVEQDQIFAVFNPVGTEQAAATRGYLNQRKVPQLLVGSGAATFGRDRTRYPWTIGFRPSDRAEGWIYGRYLARTMPGARVAALWQDDEDGRDLLAGLRLGLARTRAKVVGTAGVDPTAVDVRAEVATLRSSGADVLALFAAPGLAIQAYAAAHELGWRPLVLVAADASSAGTMVAAGDHGRNGSVPGSISISFLKDPAEPRWASDPAVRLYRTILARYAKGASPVDLGHLYGVTAAATMVELLRRAGPNPTRAGLLARVRSMAIPSNPFLLPGIVVRTSRTDGFPLEQAVLRRWSKGRWQAFGGLWEAPST